MLPRAMRATQRILSATALAAVPLLALAGPPDADPSYHANGWWDSPSADNWPMNAIHLALTPDGRVLSFGSNGNGVQTGTYIYDVWDPASGLGAGHLTLPNGTQTDIFCSAAVIIPGTDSILIAGGDTGIGEETDHRGNTRSTIYRGPDSSLIRGPEMNFGRWYASVTPLLNGEVYVQGGKGVDNLPKGPEVRRQDGTFRRLDNVSMSGLQWFYPRTYVAPDGNIFGIDIAGKMFKVNTAGTGSISAKGQFSATYGGKEATAAAFAPYKVLLVSGTDSSAIVVDFSGTNPVATPTASLSSRRAWSNATVLPNGRVLVTGGSGVPDTLTGLNNRAEIWNPLTQLWTLGASGLRPRLYHSSALLLPDATILVAGGGSAPTSPVTNMHAELYYPPYLFTPEGNLAARPTIESAPGVLAIGSSVPIVTGASDVIERVTLVRASAATHGLNNAQQFVELPFALEGGAVNAQMPANAAEAPPGYYLLFVINDAGVPSRAKIVRINPVGYVADPPPPEPPPPDPPDPPPPPPPPNPLPPVPPVLAGTSVTLNGATEGDLDLRYSWDFGDGSPPTDYSSSPTVSHVFENPGIYYVMVSASGIDGVERVTTLVVTVHLPLTANRPTVSSNIVVEPRNPANDRLWVVNPDNDSVSVFDTATNARVSEIVVGSAPRSVAIAPNGEIWVTNKLGASISVISPSSLTVTRTVALPFASQPYGVVAAPTGGFMFVALEGSGRLLKLDASGGAILGSVGVGANPRHVSVTGDGSKVYVSRFITPPLPGESTGNVQTPAGVGAEVVVVNAASMTLQDLVVLRHSDKTDLAVQGRGIPNYLGAMAISPDGQSAWVPSKQDNVKRGTLRDGNGLNFENTVRAIGSRVDLGTNTESYDARMDFDDSGVASAILHDRLGVYMFVALETSREVAVVDAHGGWEMARINVGRAPQGLALSEDGRTLYVSNFMDRTISVFGLGTLLDQGITDVPLVATRTTITTERLGATVLQGKRLFYDAKDPRLAEDAYLSCASCHNDGGHDGRTWDLTGFGEGLRNTVNLRGRAGAQGLLHWSNNFNEVQDFEGQIRALAGGTGLMTNAQFNTGTRSQPLGDPKAGVSSDLDALAAYVASLNAFAPSPNRNADGSLTAAAIAGRDLFAARNCASCHGGTAFTNSGNNNPQNIGTITADSGKRLFATLAGIDIPTLRDAWATAPYLHRGSAPTLGDAIRAHGGLTFTDAELANLVAYVSQIGSQETTAPTPAPAQTPNTGKGLPGLYFNNKTFTGTHALRRVEEIYFDWKSNSPGTGVAKDNFSVRWSGKVEASSTGNFQFQTKANDGVRLWVNDVLVIDKWANQSATVTTTSSPIALTADQRYTIKLEYFDNTGAAVVRLLWKKPGQTSFVVVPKNRLYEN